MRLLVVCSSLDLSTRLSATPAWWQLLKGLYEVGVELVVTTYHGRAAESPWWRAYDNPARLEGNLFAAGRQLVRRLTPAGATPAPQATETRAQRATRLLARAVAAPKWRRHLARILDRERNIAAVLLINVPPNHLRGVAAAIRRTRSIPVLFYDGDVPASLPSAQGFATGFRLYEGADLAEFDAVLCNSEAGAEALRTLGARVVHTLHYGADPDLYAPLAVPQDLDVFFFGHTTEYRAPWLAAMMAEPSRRMPDARFAARGHALGDLGRTVLFNDVPFSGLRFLIARSRINLAVTRDTHASVFGSSTSRPFELAMMGACIVCNPYQGIELWFEPEREIIVVHSAEEAVDRYRFLLAHDAERRRIGGAARARALAQHTFRHRAGQLARIIDAHI